MSTSCVRNGLEPGVAAADSPVITTYALAGSVNKSVFYVSRNLILLAMTASGKRKAM